MVLSSVVDHGTHHTAFQNITLLKIIQNVRLDMVFRRLDSNLCSDPKNFSWVFRREHHLQRIGVIPRRR